MTDNGNRKLTLLTVLVSVLLVAVVAQSVMMFGLHKQIRGRPTANEPKPVAQIPDDNHDSGSNLTLPPDPFSKDPFDWDLGEWDPFKEMHSMHDRINQMFGSAFNRFQDSDHFGNAFGSYSFSPDINIEDKGDRYLVTVDLPGVEDSRLDIKIDGQTLTISGSMESESKEENGGTMLRQERRIGSFQRMVTLPEPVQADRMETKEKKGVIHIEIPKADS